MGHVSRELPCHQKEEQYRHQQIYGNLSNELFLHKHNPPISRKGLAGSITGRPFYLLRRVRRQIKPIDPINYLILCTRHIISGN